MRILYVCHRFPFPPKRGGKIRPFNMVRHLASQGHHVTLVSLSRSNFETKEAQGIKDYCKDFFVADVREPIQSLRMLHRLPSKTPSSMGYFYSSKLKRRIDQNLKSNSFDLIFAHCSSVAQYVAPITGIPKILDFGDMDSQKWLEYAKYRRWPLSMGFLLEGRKLMAAEKRLAMQFDLCTCTTRLERETLESYGTGVPTDWFPNGVDSTFFSPGEEAMEKDLISFIGRMDYFPNQECVLRFCKRIFPKIRILKPNAKFLIVGADPSPAIRKLAELPGVEVTGSVADVRPYVRKSNLMVAPLSIARGTQNKVLEAMAMGIPVVCSHLAASGVDALPEEHLLAATEDDEYVKQVLRVLDSEAERLRLSFAGRARMLSQHSWDASMARMDGIIARCIANYQTARPDQ